MKLSIATDFASSTGEPASALRVIAEAGFTNIMWCHHWCDDFLYGRDEIAHIKGLLRDFGLVLSDIHGSQGVEKCWHSPVEYRRKAGVELVSNRIRMLRELDGDGTVMMHVPNFELSIGCTPFRVEGLPAAQHPYETCLAFAKDAHERCARFAKACGAPLRGK